MNTGSRVYVVAGRYRKELESQVGEVDRLLPDGGVVTTFRHGHGEDAKSKSFILAETSLRELNDSKVVVEARVREPEQSASKCLTITD